jgi:hypothetical protein
MTLFLAVQLYLGNLLGFLMPQKGALEAEGKEAKHSNQELPCPGCVTEESTSQTVKPLQ